MIKYKIVGPVTFKDPIKEAVFQRDNCKCRYCGSVYNLTIHHVKYRSHQGDNSPGNLVTICMNCHQLEHDKKIDIASFLAASKTDSD